MILTFQNPYKPGAGHSPPYLAGREIELNEFRELLKQSTILKNPVLTGLRGVGKTVLLERFKQEAVNGKWFWVGTDLSESASIDERSLCVRLMADLAVLTSSLSFEVNTGQNTIGINAAPIKQTAFLGYEYLLRLFERTPGLPSDKLKVVLTTVWQALRQAHANTSGIIFAYDEAQNLDNHREKEQFPTSLLLEVFQSLQRQDVPMMLVLTGLPTLFPKLVEARTYAERMFDVIFLKKLKNNESKEAILTPIQDAKCPVRFNEQAIEQIIRLSGGYPYFIQFICREVFDAYLQKLSVGLKPVVPTSEVISKLDKDFFSGRWAKATDRQRDLLYMISQLPNCDEEFTVHDVVEESKKYQERGFGPSQANQMLSSMINNGLIFKNRHGKYSFAVPLFGDFIRRNHRLYE
ncbi:MAG: AAA family ATPase [Deltaproteobacteria bacterium]|nr:AAA family ATPase [Deltaproteobacteria bacterium]